MAKPRARAASSQDASRSSLRPKSPRPSTPSRRISRWMLSTKMTMSSSSTNRAGSSSIPRRAIRTERSSMRSCITAATAYPALAARCARVSCTASTATRAGSSLRRKTTMRTSSSPPSSPIIRSRARMSASSWGICARTAERSMRPSRATAATASAWPSFQAGGAR